MRLAVCILAIAAGSAAQGHDFWLQPAYWQSSGNAVIDVTLQVGHGPDRQRSPIQASRILLIEAVEQDGSVVDLHPGLHLGDRASDLSAGGLPSAPSMIVLATDVNAESHLDPDRFNLHLHDEGLTDAVAWRKAHQQTTSEGSENYGRVAKALLSSSSQVTATQRPLGLELEIVPLGDPYAPDTHQLPVKVVFRGSPLKGATVKLYDLANDTAPRAICVSDAAGRCTFDFARTGDWLVNVVWSIPNAEGSATDFRTIFSSLSFGFDVPGAEMAVRR